MLNSFVPCLQSKIEGLRQDMIDLDARLKPKFLPKSFESNLNCLTCPVQCVENTSYPSQYEAIFTQGYKLLDRVSMDSQLRRQFILVFGSQDYFSSLLNRRSFTILLVKCLEMILQRPHEEDNQRYREPTAVVQIAVPQQEVTQTPSTLLQTPLKSSLRTHELNKAKIKINPSSDTQPLTSNMSNSNYKNAHMKRQESLGSIAAMQPLPTNVSASNSDYNKAPMQRQESWGSIAAMNRSLLNQHQEGNIVSSNKKQLNRLNTILSELIRQDIKPIQQRIFDQNSQFRNQVNSKNRSLQNLLQHESISIAKPKDFRSIEIQTEQSPLDQSLGNDFQQSIMSPGFISDDPQNTDDPQPTGKTLQITPKSMRTNKSPLKKVSPKHSSQDRFPKEELKPTMLSVDFIPKKRRAYDPTRPFNIITNNE